MIKRCFDIVFSVIGVILLSPIFLGIWLLVVMDSRGGGFYRQTRVGKNGIDFRLWKFRTMSVGADKGSLLTVGGRDSRITRVGYHLRRFKLDELPQLFNVFSGDMSLVGPRPEVRKYVDLYSVEQRKVLSVKPGITDYASIEFVNENDLLATSSDPEKTYIEEIMPLKLQLNLNYIQDQSLMVDIGIILRTIKRILE
jgi:lipopolysaccharide/colanic/teichoic acid biosynthesis glycosyltransferase